MKAEEIGALLRAQGIELDGAVLEAVRRWRDAWVKEWAHVRHLTLGDEDLPAPLWSWPP